MSSPVSNPRWRGGVESDRRALFGGDATLAALRALMLAALIALGIAVVVSQSALAATVSGSSMQQPNPAVGMLLEKARFWHERGKFDAALDFYNRVLSLQPGNSAALAGASKVAFDQGHDSEAQNYLERLRKVSPDDPFIAQFSTLRRLTAAESATLLQARQLAFRGQKAEALAKYRQLFTGNQVPLDLAADYYPLYISTLPDDSLEADRALTTIAKLADQNPTDSNLQLAAAWSEILTSSGRSEGIERLQKLTKNPVLTERCTSLWRQALIWEGSSFDAQAHLETYLQDHPSDPELEAKREQYVHDLPDLSVRARWKAGEAIGAKDYKTAEAQLNIALNHDKDDGMAMGMLALVRKLDGSGRDWRSLYKEAVRLAPDSEADFSRMLGLDAEKAINEKYHKVAELNDSGRYDEAESLLRSLIGSQRDPGSYLQLASIQSKAGKTDAAMTSLRMTLAGDPGNPSANEAMAEIYIGQQRLAEARPLLAKAEEGFQQRHDERGLAVVRAARVDLMRSEALAISNPAAREQALRDVLAMAPANWWVRLELARSLKQRGQVAAAQTLIDEANRAVAAPGALAQKSGQEAMQVAFTWAQESNDKARQEALVRMVPPDRRSPAMTRFLADAAFNSQVRDLGASGDPASVPMLLRLANASDPTGERGMEIGLALLRLHDVDALRQALTLSLSRTQPPTPSQLVSYAGVLMQANQLGAAEDLVAQLQRVRLTEVEREGVESLRDGLLVSQVDRMLQQGRAQQLQKLVMKRLAVHPNNAALRAALARTQIAQGSTSQPLATLTALLDAEPDNLQVRMAAIDANLKLQNYSTASEMAEEGMRREPRNPYLVMQAANAARARGHQGEALDLMIKARQMLNQSEPDTEMAEIN